MIHRTKETLGYAHGSSYKATYTWSERVGPARPGPARLHEMTSRIDINSHLRTAGQTNQEVEDEQTSDESLSVVLDEWILVAECRDDRL